MPEGWTRGWATTQTSDAGSVAQYPPLHPKSSFFCCHIVTLSHFEHNNLITYILRVWQRVITVWQQREIVVTHINPYLSASSLPPWQRDNKKWVFSIGGERENTPSTLSVRRFLRRKVVLLSVHFSTGSPSLSFGYHPRLRMVHLRRRCELFLPTISLRSSSFCASITFYRNVFTLCPRRGHPMLNRGWCPSRARENPWVSDIELSDTGGVAQHPRFR